MILFVLNGSKPQVQGFVYLLTQSSAVESAEIADISWCQVLSGVCLR